MGEKREADGRRKLEEPLEDFAREAFEHVPVCGEIIPATSLSAVGAAD